MAEARRAVEPIPSLSMTQEIDPTLLTFQLRTAEKGWSIFIPRPKYVVVALGRWVRSLYRKLQHAFMPLPIPLIIAVIGSASTWVVASPSAAWVRNSRLSNAMWKADSLSPLAHRLPHKWRVFYLTFNASTAVMLGVTVVHRMLLRGLLSYTGWADEERGKKSMRTAVWAAMLKYLYIRGGSKLTLAYQTSLPHLPLPALQDTVCRFLASMEGALDAEEMAVERQMAEQFLQTEGLVLQRYLYLKWLWAPNYVSDWWLDFVYLRSRDSILINSNYYGQGPYVKPMTTRPASRAAFVTHELLVICSELDGERFPPIIVNGVIPLCMEQYARAFRTTRIPAIPQDRLRTYERTESRHIVIMHRGRYYTMNVFSEETGRLHSVGEFEAVFDQILADPSEASPSERRVAALTACPRSHWATVREDHFVRDRRNALALDLIERSLFYVLLDDTDVRWSDLSGTARQSMHSDGCSLWLDKSFCSITGRDCNTGMNGEHSWGDAPTISQIFECVCARELKTKPYGPDGHVNGRVAEPTATVERIRFHFTETLTAIIDEAAVSVQRQIADLHLVVRQFTDFGKGSVKKAKCSPDAFIQMALQVAYYRDQHDFTQTYEAASVRFYLNGRTETIRSCSTESRAFVLALDDPTVLVEDKRKALRTACSHHSRLTMLAMTGRGVDRHLFALYVVAVGTGRNSAFLKRVLGRGWKLSTSQVPLYQSPHEWPANHDPDSFPRPSGGFGPVADDGYGVSYAVCGEKSFFFHVSSKHSAPNTCSTRMSDNIEKALRDMIALFSK